MKASLNNFLIDCKRTETNSYLNYWHVIEIRFRVLIGSFLSKSEDEPEKPIRFANVIIKSASSFQVSLRRNFAFYIWLLVIGEFSGKLLRYWS